MRTCSTEQLGCRIEVSFLDLQYPRSWQVLAKFFGAEWLLRLRSLCLGWSLRHACRLDQGEMLLVRIAQSVQF